VNAPSLTTRLDGPAPEREVSHDMVRRGLYVAPVLIAACAAIWGMDGLVGAVCGLALVLVNYLVSAALMSVTAKISLAVMMGAVLFGFLFRFGLVALAIFLVRDASWISLMAFGLTIIVTHLGLLFWELRFVSASLAFPGLKPTPSN
jgi:hypothetical protein